MTTDLCKRIPYTKLPRVAKFGWLGFRGYIYIPYMDCPSVCLWIMLEEHSGKQRTTLMFGTCSNPKLNSYNLYETKMFWTIRKHLLQFFSCCVQILGGLTLLTAGFHVTDCFFCLRNLLGSGPGNLGELAEGEKNGSVGPKMMRSDDRQDARFRHTWAQWQVVEGFEQAKPTKNLVKL